MPSCRCPGPKRGRGSCWHGECQGRHSISSRGALRQVCPAVPCTRAASRLEGCRNKNSSVPPGGHVCLVAGRTPCLPTAVRPACELHMLGWPLVTSQLIICCSLQQASDPATHHVRLNRDQKLCRIADATADCYGPVCYSAGWAALCCCIPRIPSALRRRAADHEPWPIA